MVQCTCVLSGGVGPRVREGLLGKDSASHRHLPHLPQLLLTSAAELLRTGAMEEADSLLPAERSREEGWNQEGDNG